MKTRTLPESNYKALYINGKTLRIPLDGKKPILPLQWPEFYDVKITDQCNGCCPYCYQDSTQGGRHFEDIPQKINDFFGPMTPNQRPFQVAIGGGEPTLHPEFRNICKAFKNLGIDPNYTTNGINITSDIIHITRKYVNGVAVSCHSHLAWENGVKDFLADNVYTNLHIIISDKESVDRFERIYRSYRGRVKYFVLLPLINQGRAEQSFDCWDYLEKTLNYFNNIENIAFGAMFYPYLRQNRNNWGVSLYEPESMSRYLVMDGEMKEYSSSFSTQGETT